MDTGGPCTRTTTIPIDTSTILTGTSTTIHGATIGGGIITDGIEIGTKTTNLIPAARAFISVTVRAELFSFERHMVTRKGPPRVSGQGGADKEGLT